MTEEELKEKNKAIATKLHQDWKKKYEHTNPISAKNRQFRTATSFRKRTPGQVSRGEGAWGGASGESFKDFGQRRHDEMYPGAQRMAMEAGAGGYKYFTPEGKDYRKGVRDKMTWLPEGAPYTSRDWRLYLAKLQREMGIIPYTPMSRYAR